MDSVKCAAWPPVFRFYNTNDSLNETFSRDVLELTTITNMIVVMGVSVVRGLCLAYSHVDLLKLKAFLNIKSFQRDNASAFQLRKSTYQKINKFLAVYYPITITNACSYSLTTGYSEEVFRIPYLLDGLPENVAFPINVLTASLHIPWCITVWYSPTQLLSLLLVLHTELKIIIDEFKHVYEDVAVNHVLQASDINQLTQQQKTQFLSELSSKFKYVLAYHSEFIRHLTIFKRIVSLNVFFLFVVGAIIITVNTGLFILQPSIEQLPLLLVSIQYTTEIYCFCTMFQNWMMKITNFASMSTLSTGSTRWTG
nr:uncharacterized protein LOC109433326 [Aedes albopictus]XP_029711244.1 uncharacterized protein LOC109433326 [Aedes albopictus]